MPVAIAAKVLPAHRERGLLDRGNAPVMTASAIGSYSPSGLIVVELRGSVNEAGDPIRGRFEHS